MTPDLLAQIIIGGGSVLVAVLLIWKGDALGDGNVERIEKDDRATEARWWLVRLERGWE